MQKSEGRSSGLPTILQTEHFTGDVWADPVIAGRGEVSVFTVFFPPGARTHWHSHAKGQVILVLAGSGHVVTRAGETVAIRAGDVVFAEGGEEHWHGASADAYLLHQVVSLGPHTWAGPVSDAEYTADIETVP